MKRKWLWSGIVGFTFLVAALFSQITTFVFLDGPAPVWGNETGTSVAVQDVQFHYGDDRREVLHHVLGIGWFGFPSGDGAIIVRCFYYGISSGQVESPPQGYVTTGPAGQTFRLRADSCLKKFPLPTRLPISTQVPGNEQVQPSQSF